LFFYFAFGAPKIRGSTVYNLGAIQLRKPRRLILATRQRYEEVYGIANAKTVLSSKNRVAAAGRWGDQAKIEEERTRHLEVMERLS
jgi:hypothetical protein